eukprot:TRINITY_DN3994_c0_g1_i2.p1 TRINITY_DN3994_c0_g1~~TRINITY_DN3994_c0_g1_i2.p1  ORF type:complete len:127 (+),score=15.43 TRINITY_DN3994_c0_g1_i2:198-578(+)
MSGGNSNHYYLIQCLVEKCLQLYLTREETIDILQQQSNIDPSATSLVWSKLEEQNPEYFKAYEMRLRVKRQILAFNEIIQHQVDKMPQGKGVYGGNSYTPSISNANNQYADNQTPLNTKSVNSNIT